MNTEKQNPLQVQTLKVGVLGGGIMGSAIAALFLRKGIPVTIYDIAPNASSVISGNLLSQYLPEEVLSDQTVQDIQTEHFESGSESSSLPSCPWCESGLAVITGRLSDLADCTIVFEAVAEIPDVKRQLFTDLEAVVANRCLVGTNTSTIPLSSLSGAFTRNPGRFCGVHFLHPVRNRVLTEVVRGPETSLETIATVCEILRCVGQRPLLVHDCPGFVVNRLLNPYLNESLELLRDGVPMDRIDQIAMDFGMHWGPIKTIDEIGIDTVFNSAKVMYEAFPDRVVVSPILISLYRSKCWGVKSGQGFRNYDGSTPNPRSQKWRQFITVEREIPDQEVLDRLLLPMLLESVRLVHEGIVDSPADAETAVRVGLAFPDRFTGLIGWGRSFGWDNLLRRIENLSSLGPRAQLTQPELKTLNELVNPEHTC